MHGWCVLCDCFLFLFVFFVFGWSFMLVCTHCFDCQVLAINQIDHVFLCSSSCMFVVDMVACVCVVLPDVLPDVLYPETFMASCIAGCVVSVACV